MDLISKPKISLLAFCGVAALCGCSGIPDQAAEVPNAAANAKIARDIYDRANHDPTKVTADDQAKLDKAYGHHIDPNGLFIALSGKAGAPHIPDKAGGNSRPPSGGPAPGG